MLTAFGQVEAIEKIDKQISELANAGDLEACIDLHRQAQAIYAAEEDWINYADRYCVIGYLYWNLEAFASMESYLDSALQTVRRHEIDELNDIYGVIWNYYGFYYNAIGDNQQAYTAFQKVLEIDLALYEQDKENFDISYLGYDYQNLGAGFNETGDYAKALEYFAYALQYFPKNSAATATLLNNMAFAHQMQDNFSEAGNYYRKAMETVERSPEGVETTATKKLILKNFPSYYTMTNQPDSALFYLELLRSSIDDSDKIPLAQYYQLIGETHFNAKNYAAAETAVRRALQLRREVYTAKHPEIVYSYTNLGELYAAQGEHQKALPYFQRSLEAVAWNFHDTTDLAANPGLTDNISDKRRLLRTLDGKAKSLQAGGQSELAKSTYQLALNLIDSLRLNYQAEGSKYDLLKRSYSVYDGALQLAVNTDDPEFAFRIMERNKATVLLENIKHLQARQFANLPESLLEQEQDIKVQMAFLERKINNSLGNKDPESEQKYRQQLFVYQQEYEQLIATLERDFPQYYALKYDQSLPTISEVQQQLLDPSTAMLEYFVGKDSIFVAVISNDHFEVLALPKLDDFRIDIETLRRAMNQPDGGAAAFQEYTTAAWRIFDRYVRTPLGTLPAQVTQLIVMPDGQLTQIPFQSLLTHSVVGPVAESRYDTLPYLLRDYTISYAYSARLLNTFQASDQGAAAGSFLGFAPVFDQAPSFGLGALAYSEREVNDIRSIMAGDGYLRTAASTANLRNKVNQFNILHLSTHAMIDDEFPQNSKIYFSDDFLTLSDIYALPLAARLVVLSACETGLGKLQSGEGMISLARAFMYVGCPSLVTSLWQVNDRSTNELMVDFYRQLHAGSSTAEALRTAQVDYLDNISSVQQAHPFYWSSFILVGQPDSLGSNNSNFRWLWAIAGFCAVLIGASLLRRRKKTVVKT